MNLEVSQTSGSGQSYSGISDSTSFLSIDSRKGSRYGSAKREYRRRGYWTSLTEAILFTLVGHLTLTTTATNFDDEHLADTPNLLQILVCYLLIGIPYSYMQLFLGQYTHMSIFYIRRMVPLAEGVCFSYLIVTFIDNILLSIVSKTYIVYGLLSMLPGPLQWTLCQGEPNCWEPANGCDEEDGPCLTRTTHLSGYMYFNRTFLRGTTLRHVGSRYEGIILKTLTWMAIYLIGLLSFVRIKQIVKYVVAFNLLLKVAMEGVLLTYVGVADATQAFSFTNARAWRRAGMVVSRRMLFGSFTYVMIGALAYDAFKVGTLAFIGGVASFGAYALEHMIVTTSSALLCDRTRIPIANKTLLFLPHIYPAHIVVTPMALSFVWAAKEWNALFFLSHVSVLLLHITVAMIFFHEALSHRFPTVTGYKKYTTPIYCAVSYLGSTSFNLPLSVSHAIYDVNEGMRTSITEIAMPFNAFFVNCMVAYVYGTSRLSDDVNFIQGAPPILYWKVGWTIQPLLMLLCTFFEDLAVRHDKHLLLDAFLLSPHPIFITYNVIKKIIEKNTISLVTPTDNWGPKDVEKRMQRKDFNPRQHTRYTVNRVQCKHKCLRTNIMMEKIVAAEDALVQRAKNKLPLEYI